MLLGASLLSVCCFDGGGGEVGIDDRLAEPDCCCGDTADIVLVLGISLST